MHHLVFLTLDFCAYYILQHSIRIIYTYDALCLLLVAYIYIAHCPLKIMRSFIVEHTFYSLYYRYCRMGHGYNNNIEGSVPEWGIERDFLSLSLILAKVLS